jgi:hypothetical protein
MGVPIRLVVSEKTGNDIEVKFRDSDKTEIVSLEMLAGKI